MNYGVFDHDDRRREPRYESDEIPVSVSAGGRDIPEASITDLSLGGLGVYVPGKMQLGQYLRFQVMLPAGPVSGVGVVRWIYPHHLGYRGGLQTVSLGFFHRRRLKNFLEPDSITLTGLFDNVLAGAAAATIAAIVLDHFGIDLTPVFGLFRIF